MKTTATLITLAAAAGLATASPFMATGLTEYSVDSASVSTASITLDVSGVEFWDALGSPNNEVLNLFVGQGAEIHALAWDVNLTTIGGSWASEATVDFGGQIFLNVGAGDDFGVTNQNYNSGGPLVLSDFALPSIMADANGNLRIEFFESFDDVAGAVDSFFGDNSTITLIGKNIVPAPASLALLGLGGLAAVRRRR